MAKIAAIILPSSRASQLADLRSRICQSLCLYAGHHVEAETYHGEHAVCSLLRVAPDPLNPKSQPLELERLAGVSCGYYLSESGSKDSSPRLLSDLAKGGVETLSKGDGVYAFAYWDRQRECLIAGVDKLGMRPLYWMAVPGGGYAVASEIKALVCLLDELRPNWAAWEEQLTFGFLFGEHTVFEDVQRFGVAETITFRRNRCDSRIVENFLETIDVVDRPFDQFLDEQGVVFDEAMTRLAGLYDADNDSMLTLSGGYDSRRVLGWMLNQGIQPDIFTVPEPFLDGREIESAVVREVCQSVGVSAHSVYPQSLADRAWVRKVRDLATDFESDEHRFLTILAMGVNCRDKVNYDGLAAGTQLSGSFVIPEFFEPGGQELFVKSWPRSVRAWLHLPVSDAPPLEQRVRAELERWGDNPNRFAYFYMLSRTRREISLAPHSIQANVFESLCPFLDRSMMRNALSFPPARKVDADVQMHLIKALNPALGGVPTIYSRSNMDYCRKQCRIGRKSRRLRREQFKSAEKASRLASGWSTEPFQALRFRLSRLLAQSGYDHSIQSIRWQYDKARKINQLGHFQEATKSTEAYRAATASLKSAYGQHTDWQEPL